MIARRYGEQNLADVGKTFRALLAFEVILATIMFLFLWYGTPYLFDLLVSSDIIYDKVILSTQLTKDSERVLCPLPLYHIFAFTVNCMAMLGVGALSVLVTNPRDLDSIVKEFKRYPISLMT